MVIFYSYVKSPWHADCDVPIWCVLATSWCGELGWLSSLSKFSLKVDDRRVNGISRVSLHCLHHITGCQVKWNTKWLVAKLTFTDCTWYWWETAMVSSRRRLVYYPQLVTITTFQLPHNQGDFTSHDVRVVYVSLYTDIWQRTERWGN